MRIFRSVLLVVAAVLPIASAENRGVCQTGWTQAPSSSDWGHKCYREFGHTASPLGEPTTGGYNHSDCKALCKAQSTTSRMLCLASTSEANFVAKQAHMDGWVAYTQDSSRSDYTEPAGGWGWECGSMYTPTWGYDGSYNGNPQPDNMGDDYDEDVSCAILVLDGTMRDYSCREGDGVVNFWSFGALLSLAPHCSA